MWVSTEFQQSLNCISTVYQLGGAAWLCPISNDSAALLALSAGAFPLQFTAGTLESGPKALGEVTGKACSPGF